MQKKTRLPLLMSNGIEVQTLEELKNNFLIEDVWKHWGSGVLETWLKERYYGDIVEEIEVISVLGRPDADEKLYAIFGVENPDTIEEEEEKMQLRQEKLAKLKTCVNEEKFIEYKRYINKIAFTQDDLYDFLDAGQHDIYLCGDKFEIPLAAENVTYYGVNNPIALIHVKKKVNLEVDKGIKFKDVRFSEEPLKHEGTEFLISYRPKGVPQMVKYSMESEIISSELIKILHSHEGHEADDVNAIVDEVKCVTHETNVLEAIYKIIQEKDKEECKEVLDVYGDVIKILYDAYFS